MNKHSISKGTRQKLDQVFINSYYNYFQYIIVSSKTYYLTGRKRVVHASMPLRGGHWGVPNTAIPQKISTNTVISQKKIDKYRNTASKVDEIPKLQKRGIRRNLLKDFDLFARRMRLKDIFHGKENKQHPFYVKSTWEPPVQQSVALETFLEEVKFELANSPSKRPKDNLSPGERRALHNLLGDKTIIVKTADK